MGGRGARRRCPPKAAGHPLAPAGRKAAADRQRPARHANPAAATEANEAIAPEQVPAPAAPQAESPTSSSSAPPSHPPLVPDSLRQARWVGSLIHPSRRLPLPALPRPRCINVTATRTYSPPRRQCVRRDRPFSSAHRRRTLLRGLQRHRQPRPPQVRKCRRRRTTLILDQRVGRAHAARPDCKPNWRVDLGRLSDRPTTLRKLLPDDPTSQGREASTVASFLELGRIGARAMPSTAGLSIT